MTNPPVDTGYCPVPRPVEGNGGAAVTVNGSGSTQPVSGTVAVSNFPATQAVSGTVGVSNFPATQAVSGTVGVSNFPATQAVENATGTRLDVDAVCESEVPCFANGDPEVVTIANGADDPALVTLASTPAEGWYVAALLFGLYLGVATAKVLFP